MTVPIPSSGVPTQSVPANPNGTLGRLHEGLDIIGSTIGRLWPAMRRIAESPRIDALVEAALAAENLGVASEVFEAVIDALNSASARRQAQVPQTALSGPQPAIGPDGQPVTVSGPFQ